MEMLPLYGGNIFQKRKKLPEILVDFPVCDENFYKSIKKLQQMKGNFTNI